MKTIVQMCVILEPKEHTQAVIIKADPERKESELQELRKAVDSFSAKLDKIQGVDDPRCKDCKHWGKGKASINAWRESTVCFLKRKKILHPRFKDQVIYYAKSRMSKPCNNFDRKEV
ncbi:MAG: hypothetical protein J6N70_10545 [Oribacterium sp.]|nr:hypothetical protein [Oribacterium sp.]